MELLTYGEAGAANVLVQLVDGEEAGGLALEAELLRQLAPEAGFQLLALQTADWNRDLSPWPAPAVFGREGFAGGGAQTLAAMKEILAPMLPPASGRRLFLGGYSLSGLYALWCAWQTDLFRGVAGVSPSVWFPGFAEYARSGPIRTGAVYLSLGDREERSRNPVLSRVGSEIRALKDVLSAQGLPCVLEWNPGNHFQESQLRMARGFAWLLKREQGGEA